MFNCQWRFFPNCNILKVKFHHIFILWYMTSLTSIVRISSIFSFRAPSPELWPYIWEHMFRTNTLRLVCIKVAIIVDLGLQITRIYHFFPTDGWNEIHNETNWRTPPNRKISADRTFDLEFVLKKTGDIAYFGLRNT